MKPSKMLFVVLAGLMMLAGLRAGAQMPEPFAYTPPDAQFLVRIDFVKMENSPRMRDSVREMRESGMEQAMANVPAGDAQELAKQVFKEIKMGDFAVVLPESGNADDAQMYAAVYGNMDANKIMEFARKEGMTTSEEYKGMTLMSGADGSSLTMPNSWTLLYSSTPAHLKKMIDQKEAGPSQALSSPLFAGAKDSVVFFGGSLPAAARTEMVKGLRTDDPMLLMFPGAQQVIAQLPQLNALAFTLTESDSLKANLSLRFDSEGAGQQTAAGLNMLWPQLINMTAMQVGAMGQTTLAQEMQKMATSQFSAQGNIAQGTIAIPDSLLAEMKRLQAEQEAQMQQWQQQMQQQQQPQ